MNWPTTLSKDQKAINRNQLKDNREIKDQKMMKTARVH